NDADAIVSDPDKAFLTAQAAVDAAIALNPSAAKPVTIDVGAGSFGDVRLTQDFGEHVSWKGVDSTVSTIGDVDASGVAGADGADDGLGNPASGGDGGNGFHLILNAAASGVRFGDVSVNGGQGGEAYNPD